jgi:hypothetical protein
VIVGDGIGKVGVVAGKFEDDLSAPSALKPVTSFRSNFAADFESYLVWCSIEATTSSAVTALLLWNVAPVRTLNGHFLAP